LKLNIRAHKNKALMTSIASALKNKFKNEKYITKNKKKYGITISRTIRERKFGTDF
jgi:hypothetical protein